MGAGSDTDRARLGRLLSDYTLVPPVIVGGEGIGGKNNGTVRIHTGAGDFAIRSYASLCYADPASIDYENHLLSHLDKRGLSFRVPLPIATRTGTLVAADADGAYAVVPWFRGDRLLPDRLDHVELLGRVVGEMQVALREATLVPRPGRPLMGSLFEFVSPALDSLSLEPADVGLGDDPRADELFGWWRDEAARLRAFVDGTYRGLPAQICHNDLTHNNVLVDGERGSAVLDFEFATVTPRAFDLVQPLRVAMRILDNPDPWTFARKFLRGYGRWCSLDAEEIAVLPWLFRLRAAATVLWWLGRAVATGEPGPVLARIQLLSQTAAWIDRHGDRLNDEMTS